MLAAWGRPLDPEVFGVRDLRDLAAALNDCGVRTMRGGWWHVSNVRNLVN